MFVNSVMARAMDFCDAMSPGIHIGSSSVPGALAMAELIGSYSGKDFYDPSTGASGEKRSTQKYQVDNNQLFLDAI